MTVSLAIEMFGTASSVVVALSLMMKNLRRLRILNAVGAFMFAAYGFILGSWPVFGLNAFIVVIDIYFLYRMTNREDAFSGMKADLHSEYAKMFLDFWRKDILKFNPEYSLDPSKSYEAYFVLRDMVPVSILIYRKRGEDSLDIDLDYAIPNYRDTKNSRYFFDWAAKHLVSGKSAKFYASAEVPEHKDYLLRMGFVKEGSRSGPIQEYVKST